MRAKLFVSLFLALGLSVVGCASEKAEDKDDEKAEKDSDDAGEKDTDEDEDEDEGLKEGDTVVAQWSGTSFYEGKVEGLGSKVEVAWADDSGTAKVAEKMVFPLPTKSSKTELEEGDFVLAKWGSGTKWYGAKVTKVGKKIGVHYTSDGSKGEVTADKVLPAPKSIRGDLEKELAHVMIANEAMEAGQPYKPSGWKPKAGEEVVAVWAGTTWYQGTIESTSGPKVKWKDGSDPSEPAGGKVVPVPSSDAPAAEDGDYVLIAPESSTGFATWKYGKVESMSGDKATVMIQDGTKRTVGPSEYLVID